MALKGLWLVYTRILFVELAYWIVSISMVFVNEFVLSTDLLTDDLTVFITIFQILFSLGILVTLNFITKLYLSPENVTTYSTYQPLQMRESADNSPNKKLLQSKDNGEDPENTVEVKQASENSDTNSNSPGGLTQLFFVNIPNRIDLNTCKTVFPLSILFIGMLLLNNFCLKNVGVAFYFVSRSLTTVFNVIFTYFLIHEPVSRNTLICCAFIVFGFFLGIDQESVIGSLSVIGVIFGVASSLFGSLFSIYTKKTLAKLDGNIWTLIFYNHINAIVLCTPLLIIHGDIQALVSEKVISPTFWSLLSISGVMSFMISIVTNASIKYTSPLTHNISGTAKACFQTVIAVIYNDDRKSPLWWLSNLTILASSGAYSRIRQVEMERKMLFKGTGPARSNQSHVVESRDVESLLARTNDNTSSVDASDEEV